MNKQIPDWMLEMSRQLREQPGRCTSDPFWQVRVNEYLATDAHRNVHHWCMFDDSGEFWRSDRDGCPLDAISKRFSIDAHAFEVYSDELTPEELYQFEIDTLDGCYCQEVEKVVSTHLTENDALGFIKRHGHNYPGAFTYVESAHASPQIKQLREWLMSLTEEGEGPDVQ